MSGYYHAKRTLLAKQYLATREAEENISARDFQLEVSRAWLDDYHCRPHPSRFNWAPRWPFTPLPIKPYSPKDTSNVEGKEIIEGEFTVVENAGAAGSSAGEPSEACQGLEPAQPHGTRRRPTRTGDFDTPF